MHTRLISPGDFLLIAGERPGRRRVESPACLSHCFYRTLVARGTTKVNLRADIHPLADSCRNRENFNDHVIITYCTRARRPKLRDAAVRFFEKLGWGLKLTSFSL